MWFKRSNSHAQEFRKIVQNEGPKSVIEIDNPESTFKSTWSNYKDYSKYGKNYSKNAKYTLISFLPLALFLQLTRPVNIYFGLMTLLWLIPIISPFRLESVIFPYAFIILVSLFREAVEDI